MPGQRMPQFPESIQSLDNIDLAIFGSRPVLADSSTTVNSTGTGPGTPAVAASNVTSRALDSNNNGVLLDVSAAFTRSRAPARLMTPRFRPRTHRPFDQTALYPAEETLVKTWERNRSGIFTRL